MLVQFSVENFRSIKEEQTLSMVKSSAYKEFKENIFTSNAPSTPDLLKTAVIYGANASGKSNFLKGLSTMQSIVEQSFNKDLRENIKVTPFILDVNTASQPTTFQISLIINLAVEEDEEEKLSLVEYGFSVDKHRVFEEWLSVYPKGKEQAWFHRYFDENTDDYIWKESSYLKGRKSNWKSNTRSDQLFLSTAVHLNSKQLKPIYEALLNQMHVIGGDRISPKITQEMGKKPLKELLISFLQQADIDLVDIKFEKPKNIELELPEFFPDKIRERIYQDLSESMDVFFIHLDKNRNEVKINLREESDGTQKLFEFTFLIFSVISQGSTLVIDEFNKSLHPDLVRYLVKLFNSEHNKNGQLIFTTHETSILRRELLRRDQIWFCEKDIEKETSLYPLSDFSPIGREDLEESYLHGRYGGKPLIKEFTYTSELIDFLYK